MKKSIVLLSILVCTLSCKDSIKSSDDEDHASSITGSPCDLLTDDEIKSTLDLSAEAETTVKERDKPFPSCFYKWESITYFGKTIGTQPLEYPAEMSIVMLSKANKDMYETSIKTYDDGQKVNDVGDMATWSDNMNQVTFLYRGKLIHVHVKLNTDTASNRTKAIKLAQLIGKKLYTII